MFGLIKNVTTKKSLRGVMFHFHTDSKAVALSIRLLPGVRYYKAEYCKKSKDYKVQFRF